MLIVSSSLSQVSAREISSHWLYRMTLVLISRFSRPPATDIQMTNFGIVPLFSVLTTTLPTATGIAPLSVVATTANSVIADTTSGGTCCHTLGLRICCCLPVAILCAPAAATLVLYGRHQQSRNLSRPHFDRHRRSVCVYPPDGRSLYTCNNFHSAVLWAKPLHCSESIAPRVISFWRYELFLSVVSYVSLIMEYFYFFR